MYLRRSAISPAKVWACTYFWSWDWGLQIERLWSDWNHSRTVFPSRGQHHPVMKQKTKDWCKAHYLQITSSHQYILYFKEQQHISPSVTWVKPSLMRLCLNALANCSSSSRSFGSSCGATDMCLGICRWDMSMWFSMDGPTKPARLTAWIRETPQREFSVDETIT